MNIVNLKNQDENEFENFLSWLEEDLNRVNRFILENLAGSISLVTKLSNYIVNSGGKRIRPLLTIACAKLCGYSGTRHILHASVIEFIHTATLLHDDVVDNSKKRRGRKTANYVWDNKSSILVGDYLLSKAFRLLTDDGSMKCIKIISDVSVNISHGEVKQLIYINNLKTTESQYLDIISDKTAQLFSAACKISAEICEIDEEKKEFLSDFGKFIGIAYQIVDDTLDYFCKSDESGKEPGNDLKEKKMTLPLILCYQRGNTKEKRIIESILSKDNIIDDDFKKIVGIMEKYNIKFDCLAKAKHFSIMAKDSLGIFKESATKEKIIRLVDFLINRQN